MARKTINDAFGGQLTTRDGYGVICTHNNAVMQIISYIRCVDCRDFA